MYNAKFVDVNSFFRVRLKPGRRPGPQKKEWVMASHSNVAEPEYCTMKRVAAMKLQHRLDTYKETLKRS
jgi:hypothetical protein